MHGLSHQFPIAWKKTGKPIEWEKPGKLDPGKILQNPSYVENLGNWYSYLSHSMGAFFPLDSHPMVYFMIYKIHGFPHQFLISLKNAAKSIKLGESGKLVPFFPQYMGTFFSSDFHLMEYFTTCEMHGFSHQFLITRENAAKSTL